MFTQHQYEDIAQLLACDVATIKAVAEVESSGKCFTPQGRLLCLFEGHLFWRYVGGIYETSHPTLCYRKWVKTHYKKNVDEEYTDRFSVAFRLNADAAMKSTSWGAFQILGEHYIRLGFNTVGELVDYLKESEDNNLAAFAKFVQTDKRLLAALQKRDWATFAYRYNGSGYKLNQYDTKLQKAYLKFS